MIIFPSVNVIAVTSKLDKTKSPYEIAEQYGIGIEYLNLKSVDACYLRMEKGLVCLSKQRLTEDKKVFVIWHELGHHFLHRDEMPETKCERFYAEIEANMFANIMMGESAESINQMNMYNNEIFCCTDTE